jgi:hypothetical protein
MAAFPTPMSTALQPVVYTPTFETNQVACVVVIEGVPYLPVHATIEHNAHGATDSAEFTLPVSSNPDFSVMFARSDGTGGTPNNALVPVYVSIYAGFPANRVPESLDFSQLSQRFFGIVDLYSAQIGANEVTFKCRSMAAPLVDFPVTSLAMNVTTTQLVTALAQSVGLTPNILLNPNNPPLYVQEVFANEFVGGQNFASTVVNERAWDLLLKCALFDDVDVWVSQIGGISFLNYCAPGLIPRTTVGLTYGTDIEEITVEHSIQYAKNIHVEVHSYNKRIKQSTSFSVDSNDPGGITSTPTTKTVTSSPIFGTSGQVSTSVSPTGVSTTTQTSFSGGSTTASTSPGRESAKERYVVYPRNLSPIACQQLAQSMWRQISMQEYRMTLTIPMTTLFLFAFDTSGISILLNVMGLPYRNANSVFSGTAPITNTATLSYAGSPVVTSNTVTTTRTDTRYWPRRITETIDPSGAGWKLVVESVNHSLPQGQI